MNATPTFFASAAEFRAWLERNHARATELWVGFNKKGSGRGGLTYLDAVDEALCFGWIDGLTKSIDVQSYMQRYTPRKPDSNWSLVNVSKFERLKKAGRMQPAGLKAFTIRDPKKSGVYSFENRPQDLPPAFEKVFRARKKAWAFWQSQPPGRRRVLLWWIVSAKQEDTRRRRLDGLITACTAGHIDLMKPPSTKQKRA